ncbi:MAG: DNA mismatch repair protein MutS [Oscillospiraceae bacterium]|nr:DNA mismatch repair protein MutS [Oscillospiraceae bacterium]
MMAVQIDFNRLSPMMKQYFSVKNKYKDHILFFRLGDFYEMFFEDAIIVSRELELTLTGRDCGLDERAPMCGIPYHASEMYIKRLIELGHRVAICEQLTDPKDVKNGIVERDVIRIVTPGTLTESALLDESKNNYICAAFAAANECSVCFADISTGEVHLFKKTSKDVQTEIINELSRFDPAEVLFNDRFLDYKQVTDFIKSKMNCSVQMLDVESFDVNSKKDVILKQFSVPELCEIGLSEESTEAQCVCGLFDYISDTQKALVGRFTEIKRYNDSYFMELDLTARRNLELTETMRNKEKKGSLLWVLDHTQTSMGKRLLKAYIEQPLIKPAIIINRLDAVEQLCRQSVIREELSDQLSGVYDIERLMTRVMYKTATPRDIKSLSLTALKMPDIKMLLENFNCRLLRELNQNIHTLNEISGLIENAIKDEPSVNAKEGGVIKDGFNEELDRLRNIIKNGENIIKDIEQRERDRTEIKNLKISYNRVFGYYIEVTKSYYDKIPPEYIRKQTLANCERFITEELKKTENEILGANEKVLSLEYDIFCEVRDFVATQLVKVQETASAIAQLDVLCSFAYTSLKNEYTKPDIAIDGIIDIKDGRHPVVELMLTDEMYVPNDTYLDTGNSRMSIITGPNMSGKSTYMRQTALICLMAQIGCFVPARYAKISIVDKIFTRVGASDDLTAGQSTFMVEMSEVADILKNATKQSLVILDEVGRGTSTYDGISIATAVAEYIANSRILGCKTLFATHYHELIKLEDELDGVKNYSVAVKKRGDNIKFLRKIVPGGVDDSYGIDVAKLAGLPNRVLNRAKQLLAEMETEKSLHDCEKPQDQISFVAIGSERIIDKLRKTNVDELTDEDAKYFLKELCGMLD